MTLQARLLVPGLCALVLATAGVAGVALGTGSPLGTLLVTAGLALAVGLLVLWAGLRPQAAALQQFERLSGQLRSAQEGLLQRERLLQTVVDGAPMAIVLYSDSGRIVFTNSDARELFFEGKPVEGLNFLTMLTDAPPPLRQALLSEGDGLFTVEQDGTEETYHLSKRTFELDAEPHSLLMVKHLTRELSRQEADVWKRAIRVMSHELNNSLAPISSLVHSARLIAQRPEHLDKLERVFSTLDERAQRLHGFLEGYARMARLPRPRPVPVRWADFFEGLRALFPQVSFSSLPQAPGHFDPAQLEQVLINLLKNATEAGGPPESISVEVQQVEDGFRLCVLDRGRGLSTEVLQHALLPFYSTKEKGSGLGLALCREIIEAHRGRLWLENREGGGARVSCWLPDPRQLTTRASSRVRLTLTRG